MQRKFFANRNLLLLWIGHVISHGGDAIYQIALPWLVLEITGSKTTTSLVALSAYLPAVLFSLMAGVWVDRFDRRRIMIFADVARMLMVALLVGYLLSGGTSPVILGLIAFTLASFATLFYPARDALIPDLVDPTALSAANAFISTSGQFAHLAGPILAGLLVAWVGLTHLFTIDALTFGASLLCLILITLPSASDLHEPGHGANHWSDLMEGLRFVWRKRPLGLLILLTALNNLFIMGPAVVGMPIFVREVLALGFRAFALIEALMAGGMLLGSFLIWRLASRSNPARVLFLGMILDGLTYSLLFFMGTYAQTKGLIFLHGIGIPMITITRTTIIQRAVPQRYRGRVFSMVNMSVIGLTALSAALVGPLAEVVPIATIFLGIGLGAAACGLIGLSHRGMMNLVSGDLQG
ncbi:MAG: MFS transporter [Candidatus Marinimicrobia bacterium]|nr:MFS transporter [Candidatus Neomarinimicrobiota bacterium]